MLGWTRVVSDLSAEDVQYAFQGDGGQGTTPTHVSLNTKLDVLTELVAPMQYERREA